MGSLTSGGTDLALQVASGTLTGLDDAGESILLRGNFNVSVWGTFVATVALERSFDGGSSWIRVTFSDGNAITYTAAASAVWSEPEFGVSFRLRCSAYTSGSINWRLSLGSDAPTATPINISDGAPNILPMAPLNILSSTYNAITNTPSIASSGAGVGSGANNGYVVATAGTVAADSIGTVSIGDIIFNSGGTKWLRAPYSAVYKTMSLQNADAVAITGGTIRTLGTLSFTTGEEFVAISGANPFEFYDELGWVSVYLDRATGAWVSGAIKTDAIQGTAGTVTIGDSAVVETNDGAYAVFDEYGFSSISIAADGSVQLPGAYFQNASIDVPVMAVLDVDDEVVVAWDSATGVVQLPGMDVVNSDTSVAFEIVDEFGFSIGQIAADGGAGTGVFASSSSSGGGSGDSSTFTDTDIAARDGVALGQSALILSQANTAVMRPTKTYNLIIGYGQSLSIGSGGAPALSTSQPYDSLRFGGNTIPSDGTATTFIPYTDSLFHPLVGTSPQTVSLSLTNQWRKQQLQWRALDLDATRLLVANDCGVGSRAIEQLSKGASPELFNRLRSYVTQAQAAVTAVGGGATMGITAFCYIQGENNYIGSGYDTTEAGYRALLLQLYSDFCTDVVTSTGGQATPPAMFVLQTSSGWDVSGDRCTIGMAQLNAGLDNQNIYLVGPNYHVPDNGSTGATHPNNEGYLWLGLQFGKVMHKVLEKGEGWRPLHATRASFRGTQILVEFHVPEPPLVFDLPYYVTTPTDYAAKGFAPYDDFGAITIDSVEIVGAATILITTTRETRASWTPMLQYAGKATFEGSGCVRDSDPTQSGITFSLTGDPFPLHNWCCAFNIPIVEA